MSTSKHRLNVHPGYNINGGDPFLANVLRQYYR